MFLGVPLRYRNLNVKKNELRYTNPTEELNKPKPKLQGLKITKSLANERSKIKPLLKLRCNTCKTKQVSVKKPLFYRIKNITL